MKKPAVLIGMMVCYVLVTGVLSAQDTPNHENGVPASASAVGPAKNDNPTTVAGVIKDLPVDGGKPVATLGHRGCLVIRSPERWKAVTGMLTDAGWTDKEALPKIDFDKRMVVLAFNYGDQGDKFSCHSYSGNADKWLLELQVDYGGYRRRVKEVNDFRFLLVTMPKAKNVEVAISTSGYGSASPDGRAAATLEWKATFGPDSGDIADGLRGAIGCDQKTVKAGEDISVAFTLELTKPDKVANGHLAKPAERVFVWDGKYSNGYRNHAFEVRTPDGTTHFLQPKERDWRKNIPHPEEVTPEKPYILPEWRDGDKRKSLKALGLDTSTPGIYTIVGIYAQTGEETKVDGKPVYLWGGDIATNTITVKVTKD